MLLSLREKTTERFQISFGGFFVARFYAFFSARDTNEMAPPKMIAKIGIHHSKFRIKNSFF